MSKQVITEALEAQGRLQPGTEGWWQVWGASSRDVRAGDMVMVIWGKGTPDEEFAEYLIDEILDREIVAPKFKSSEGETFRIGALQPIILMRRGTHHTLADSL